MTGWTFFLRFTLSYTLVMASVGFFSVLIEMENPSLLNTPILMGIAYWCFYSYSIKNARIVQGKEKWRLVLLATLGDLLASIVLATPTALVAEIPFTWLLMGFAIVIPLHLLIFIGTAFFVKRQLVKLQPGFDTSSD
ncbi:ABZJ_00895 family protein [Bowmanella sp. Y26]|uniref:ABZJ_00895 family protein n=1 Tax=Bowmanella yangjiangensis TaxID=2811230 RepID=UPI001BDD539E|nr:ABZJ_00895 family protein [Bowmanella yangjiangensis]MBT1064303.1 ABZJ_00895 family protein [Bowmanella yangjiangensis]